MEKDLTIIIKTFDRHICIKNLLKSIYEFYKNDIKIIICDDGKNKFDIKSLQNEINIDNIKKVDTKFDIGLSKGRNILLNMVETKYFLLADDDHEFTENTKLEVMYDILEKYKKIDLVASDHWIDIINGKKSIRRYNGKMYKNGHILYCKTNNFTEMIDEYKVYDYTLNFFMARTKKIKEIYWDNDLKILEHLEFFYRAKNKIKSVITDKVIINHRQILSANYKKYRLRNSFYSIILKRKLGVLKIFVDNKEKLG